ncbi:MAG TPA: MASE1 domain-containing protein [Holophagaceae bacterium]|nr:MASE1 domain-containing protein [Holophagaceae bacterium]
MSLLAGAYTLAAKLGLGFAFAGANISPLWPPTGLAIAALVLFGLRLWPGVLLGALLANLVVSPLPAWVALGISGGNCAEAVAATLLLRRWTKFQPAFPRLKDTLYWFAFAMVAGPLISASAGTTILALAGIVAPSNAGHAWWTWFSGDALGALVVGPVLLTWSQPPPLSWHRPTVRQGALILATLAAVSALVFLTPIAARADLSPLAFATLPLLFWAGHRHGPRGATLGALVVCAFAIWGTAGGLGAYSGFQQLNEKMRLLQAFIALTATTSLCLATVVAERDRAREKRQLSEEGFRRLVHSVKDYAIFMLDPEGRVISWNEGAERIKGYRAEEILGLHADVFYPPEEVAAGKPAADLRLAASQGSLEEEGWRIRKDGFRFYAHTTLTAVRNGGSELRGFAKVTQDITERMRMLERLRAHEQELEHQVQVRTRQLAQSQQTLFLIYDGVQDPMAMVTAEPEGTFRIASCNRAFSDLLKATPRELVGKSVTEAVGPAAEREALAALREAARSGLLRSLELRLDGAEGARIFDVQLTPLLDDTGACACILAAGRDISERQRVEEAARKSQKLESLGVMAGGIAHDFNNLLTGIMGNASLGLLSVEPGSRGSACFERIEQAATRAADLTRQLLAYSGKGRFTIADVDLNAVVQEMTRLFPSSLPRGINLRNELQEGLPVVKADPVQMQQAVMNLLSNAAEAIGEDREAYITIRTACRQLDAAYLEDALPESGLPPGSYVTLEVTDTGAGMTPEVQSKIFDPFFTTKFTGRGLGLPALLGILRSHRGGIKVYSEPGVGSTFTLFLPAAEAAVPAPPPAVDDRFVWEGTVLLVDDDDMIRPLAARIAEHLGLTVLVARDGLEALEIFRQRHRELDLVVMDLTMPRMGGAEALARMREVDPKIPIVLTSGFDEQDVVQPFLQQELAGFLQKPYRREAFVRALQQGLLKSRRLREGSGPVRTV